jgi:glycerol-3-phosphate O-acyltransferase
VKRAVSLERCLESGRPEAVTELLEQAERVTRVASPRGDLLQVTPETRSALDLYRATVGHALVWPGVIALALRGERSREELQREASEWLDLLSGEYFPIEGEARRERIERVLAHLAARGWITATAADRIAPSEPGVSWLAFLRAQLQPLLEAYAAVARVVAESKGEGTRDAWIKRAQEAQREELLTGEAQFPEGVCAVAAGNALELLLRLGMVVADGNPLRGETAFQRGPRFDDLDALRARLAAGRDTR